MALKYEHIQPGTRIRAYDYEPREGVSPKYIEGFVIEHGEGCPHKRHFALVVSVDEDTSWNSENYQGRAYTRVGTYVNVPMEIRNDYDGRVRICTERCDL